MADNDEALAGTALALNEDAKAARRRKPKAETPAPAPADDGRVRFQLDDDQAAALREALADDTGVGDPVADFWKDAGTALGFDPETLVLIDLTDEGPVVVKAVPTAAASAAGNMEPNGEAAQAYLDVDRGEHSLDEEARTNAGLELMEEAALGMDIESATLVGDLTTGLLEIVKNVQKPWTAHSQHEKRDLVAKIEHIAKIVARQAVDVVAADDRVTVKAILEKIAIGDKTMITLKLGAMPEDDMADAIQSLFHAQKKSVLIVTADADRHMGKRREIVPPDEEEFPFDAGSDAPKMTDADILPVARRLVATHRKATVPFLQSEMRISHNAAVRALEAMQAGGDIGPADESGLREVLMPEPDDSDLAAGGEAAEVRATNRTKKPSNNNRATAGA
jgi:DNA segregation ATPase FtsK/SpoIIIE-like protein